MVSLFEDFFLKTYCFVKATTPTPPIPDLRVSQLKVKLDDGQNFFIFIYYVLPKHSLLSTLSHFLFLPRAKQRLIYYSDISENLHGSIAVAYGIVIMFNFVDPVFVCWKANPSIYLQSLFSQVSVA